jgi:hypothetical protein
MPRSSPLAVVLVAALVVVAAGTAMVLARDGNEAPTGAGERTEAGPVPQAALVFAASVEAIQEPDREAIINHLGVSIIPARGELKIPLAFEDSPHALVFVAMDPADKLSARVGETVLVPTAFFGDGVLVGQPARKANAELTLTNSSSDAIAARLLILIRSARQIHALMNPGTPKPGETVEVRISGTELAEGDQPHIRVVDMNDGDVVIADRILEGNGPSWSTTFVPPNSGLFQLFAWVRGARPRYDTVLFSVRRRLGPAPPAATTTETGTTDRDAPTTG